MKTLKQLANNQVVICEGTYGEYKYEFYSYGSFIASYKWLGSNKKELTLSSLYDYSRTTSKYLKIFLQDYCDIYYEDKKELNKMIRNGGNENVDIQVVE